MKNSFAQSCGLRRLVLASSLWCLLGQMAAVGGEVTFTNDTVIATGNTNYEGQDIVIRSCMVTVQGTHAFNSVQVAGTLILAGGSTLNVSGTLAVQSRVVCWGANATGQATSQLAGATVTVNASNVVVAPRGMIMAWEQPWLPWGQSYPFWESRRLLWEQRSKTQVTPAGFRASRQFGARPQAGTNAAPVR